MNLIVNASHAIQDVHSNPPKKHAITIKTSYDENAESVTVSIQDTGKGIPAENLSKVFDPGFTTKGAGVGTGLGLALCYRIVEKHQGRISLTSVVNEGTTFSVEIPARALNKRP
jgi:signal transduction histidine kinase